MPQEYTETHKLYTFTHMLYICTHTYSMKIKGRGKTIWGIQKHSLLWIADETDWEICGQ